MPDQSTPMPAATPTEVPSTPGAGTGRFVKGERRYPATEFKKGQHWRPPAVFRDKDYLVREYVEKQRSTGDIARENNVTDAAVLFWLRKHGITRRDTSQARKVKRWGVPGEANPMYGRRGADNPSWKGGCTPDRQAFYASLEWRRAARQVRQRDGRACRRCGKKKADDVVVEIHHIVSFAVVELRAEVTNLVLLCTGCHDWVHSNDNTDKLFIGGDS